MIDFQPLANHLWQSTVFAAVVGFLTLALRNNRAQTRYALWLAASLKFLVPFSLLIQVGTYFQLAPAPAPVGPSRIALAVDELARPFVAPSAATAVLATPHPTAFFPALLLSLWTIGFFTLSISWWRRWRHVRAAIRAASPLHLSVNIRALSSPAFFEPGVFGIFRPTLLLPEGIDGHLSPAQFEAILAHELTHVRRRDNLATALHMLVEAIFWFHPLVWWLGARLMEERERACDEAVLRSGSDPEAYAEGILKICELYLACPSQLVAGVTGANLKQRIEDIMTNRAIFHLNGAKRLLLTAAALFAVVGPIILGLADQPSLRAQSNPPKAAKFEVASIKPHAPGNNIYNFPEFLPGGRFLSNAPLLLVVSTAFNLPFNPSQRLTGVPGWANSPEGIFDIEATGTIPPGLSDQARADLMRSMLVSLLADRFKMTYHRETKEIPIYALTVGKSGPKLQKADIAEKDCPATNVDQPPGGPGSPPVTCHDFNGGRGRGLHARAASMADVVRFVENWTDRPLLDKTGLKGLYKFDTKGWLPMEVGPPPAAGAKAEDGRDVADVPTIFEIFDQMGLKMEPQKSRVDIYVIDHLEKPTGN